MPGVHRRLLISMGLLAFLVLGHWAAPATAQTTDQPSGTISVQDDAAQDAAIATRLREILSELDGFEDVTVTVSSGIVTLRGTTLDSATAQRLTEIAGRVEGVVAIENEVRETTDVARRLTPALDRIQERISQIIAFLPLFAVAFGAFVLVVLLGMGLARLREPWDRIAPNAFIADILRTVIRLAFVVAGIVIALDLLGATALLGTILGAAGIIGLAIGFAVRDTVENFIASIMLSIRQPFRPNDTVEIEGDTGKVIRLTSRATILLSFDGNQIRIPNATVFKSRIINFSRNDERRFVIDLGVAYGTDLVVAQALALDTVSALPFVLRDPAPAVWIEELGESAVVLHLAAWIAQHDTSYLKARSEAWRLCMAAFDAHGIVMPERTLRVLGLGGADPAPLAQPAPVPGPAPVVHTMPEVVDVGATMDAELDRIVEGERRDPTTEDLLTKDALAE